MRPRVSWPLTTTTVLLLLAGAGAQERRTPDLDLRGQDSSPVAVLARVCGKEAWPSRDGRGFADCPAIGETLRRVGRGDVVRGARLHSVKVFQPERLKQRPWIAFLRADRPDEQPRGWPANMSWTAQRPLWRALVALSRSTLEGPGEPPCEPDTWGGPMDRERARRLRYIRVDCGPTLNDFYKNPPRWAVTRSLPAVLSIPARLAAGHL